MATIVWNVRDDEYGQPTGYVDGYRVRYGLGSMRWHYVDNPEGRVSFDGFAATFWSESTRRYTVNPCCPLQGVNTREAAIMADDANKFVTFGE